jgi:hypothetical protein
VMGRGVENHRPELGDGVDPAFVVRGRAERLTVVEPGRAGTNRSCPFKGLLQRSGVLAPAEAPRLRAL